MLFRSPCLLVSLSPCLLVLGAASAQDREPPALRLAGLVPSGVRTSLTESWGTFDFSLTNLTDTDRQSRVFLFYEGQPDVQYGRDVWVPARSTLSAWMLVGPAPMEGPTNSRDIQVLLYERSGGKDRLILPPTEERRRSRAVYYRKREPSTAILLDEPPPDEVVFGQLPQPESRADEAVLFARTFRHTRFLSEFVQTVYTNSLPLTAEAFDGIDHFILASGRLAYDSAGMRALRQWLEGGGTVWVMLDLVEPEAVAPLLGDALDFQVVDRVSLTTLRIATRLPGKRVVEEPVQEYDRPVEFVRVLLPLHEQVRHTVNGWPAWFTRQVGRGKVVFTTLGARGWYRPRQRSDRPSPYQNFPSLPVPTEPLEGMAEELQPELKEPDLRVEAFKPLLTEEIGYSVARRGTVGLIFGGFLVAASALGLALRRSRRPELLGWLGPAAALGAAGTFVALGELGHRAVPPTVAVGQVVYTVSGTQEVAVDGLLAVYRPAGGLAEAGAPQGGLFELDMTGLAGQIRRRVLSDIDSWHWENLALPAGVRFAPFRYTAQTGEPINAVASFGPDGVEGKLTPGPFRDLGDALLHTPGGRKLAVRLRPDGTFSAGSPEILAAGQFLASSVLSDRQQRRQEFYREFLQPLGVRLAGRNVLLAWAEPIDTHFTLAPQARRIGDALLVIPLQLKSPAPGARLTVPGPFIPYRRVLEDGLAVPPPNGLAGIAMRLRFQLPLELLPVQVERARLAAKIYAPSRRVTVAGQTDGEPVEIFRVENPLDPIRIEITEKRLLHLDEDGGLHLNVVISDSLQGGEGGRKTSPKDEEWTIEYLELEVTGQRSEPEA